MKAVITPAQLATLTRLAPSWRKLAIERPEQLAALLLDDQWALASTTGSQLSRRETATLLLTGITPGHQPHSRVRFAVNLAAAQREAIAGKVSADISVESARLLHRLVMTDIFEDEELGTVREDREGKMYQIFNVADKMKNTFEKAAYLICEIAALRPFGSSDIVVAHLIQIAVFVKADLLPPLLNIETANEFTAALKHFGESGDFELYAEYMMNSYQHVKSATKLKLLRS